MSNITITYTVSWWVKPYLETLNFLCLMLGTEPNEDKVVATVMKGIRVR